MRALAIAGVLALMASAAHAQGYNPTTVGQGIVSDCTVSIASTGTPQQVLARSGTPGAAQGNRTKVYLENASSHTMGFSLTLTNTLSIASTQQFLLSAFNVAGTNWWSSGSEFVPMNAIWAIGQTGDVLVCVATGP